MSRICSSCAGNPASNQCQSYDCPVIYQRVLAEAEAQQVPIVEHLLSTLLPDFWTICKKHYCTSNIKHLQLHTVARFLNNVKKQYTTKHYSTSNVKHLLSWLVHCCQISKQSVKSISAVHTLNIYLLTVTRFINSH